MGLLAVLVIFIIGVVLLIEMDTGKLGTISLIGIAFIATAIAFLVGVAWPNINLGRKE